MKTEYTPTPLLSPFPTEDGQNKNKNIFKEKFMPLVYPKITKALSPLPFPGKIPSCIWTIFWQETGRSHKSKGQI